jgi:hypothetical protein
MFPASRTQSHTLTNVRGLFAKTVILLVISLGLLWFSEQFSPTAIFEPQSIAWKLWVSYAKDLIQPFAFYFFICLGERWLQTWRGRALLAFAVPTLLEVGQGLYDRVSGGHYVGSFDPVDIVIYAVAVGLAVIMDNRVFAKLFKFWGRKRTTLYIG